MNRTDTAKAIAVMQHYVDGGEVEYRILDEGEEGKWRAYSQYHEPTFDWSCIDYRMAQPKPPECPPEIVALLKYAPDWAGWVTGDDSGWHMFSTEPAKHAMAKHWDGEPISRLTNYVPLPADWTQCKWRISDLLSAEQSDGK